LVPSRPPIPASLLTDCPPAPDPEDGRAGTTLRYAAELKQMYIECRAGKRSLADAVR
jgi:hypothetical protein